MTAGDGLGFKYGHIVPLFIQVISSGEAAAAGADDGNLFAGTGRDGEIFFLPALSLVMLRGKTLEVADGDRLVEFVALTAALTAVVAHIAQSMGEGHLFTDDTHSLVAVAFLNGTDIGGDVNVGRALGLAGDEGLFPGFADGFQLVPDGAGGTDLCAGSAETAVRVIEQLVVEGAYIGFQTLLLIVQNAYTAEIPAGTDAAAAEHAAVHVVNQQGIALVHLHALGSGTHTGIVGAEILDQSLQFAVAVLGTGGAVFGMATQQQLQRQSTELAQLFALGANHQTVLCFQQAGLGHTLLTVHFYHTQAAGAVFRQVRMMAQMGDVDSGFQRAVQNIFSVLYIELNAIDGNNSHDIPSSLVICFGG